MTVWTSGDVTLYLGDCLSVLPTLEENSIPTIITDPPYGLEFMGKDWDHGVPGVRFWKAMLRVAKPGAMLLAFGGTRTHHRLMCAIEDAGWVIRDCLMWLYGSGFPKSHDISKAIDKEAGAEREVIGRYSDNSRKCPKHQNTHSKWKGALMVDITAPATPAAQLWDGWGTALKPAWEIIILAMKPIDGTFAQNALEYGVAGLWIDGGRIATKTAIESGRGKRQFRDTGIYGRYEGQENREYQSTGRWPANLILDEEAGRLLDEQSGDRPSTGHYTRSLRKPETPRSFLGQPLGDRKRSLKGQYAGDNGGASRFFYCAKASRSERTCNGEVENGHPTVKPLSLMRYLCKLTKTPTGGVVLDPFMGSGSTGCAAVLEGRSFVGIELEPSSFDIARQRIQKAQREMVQAEMAL